MTNRQYFYNTLRNAGLTHAAVIGFLGNLDCESPGCEPCRIEGDFSADLKKSKEYAAKVDSDQISQHSFATSGGGWGAAQWTWHTRKENLWTAAKKAGKSIGDRSVQADFIVWELKEYFPSLLKFLKETTNRYAATKRICEEYEQPAVNNIAARYARALEIEKEISKPQEKPAEEKYWPPRMLDKNMTGPDVFALQGILCARGLYKGSMTGRFDDVLEAAVKAFQKDQGLGIDGVAGPKTWSKLTEVQT